MLPDYKSDLTYSPLKLRHLHFVTFELLFAGGGAVSVVNSALTPGNSAASFTAPGLPNVPGQTTPVFRTGTGQYTVQLPNGMAGMLLGGSFERNAAGVTTGWAVGECSTFALRAENAVAGSYLLSTLTGAGAEADPVSGSTLKLCFLLSKI